MESRNWQRRQIKFDVEIRLWRRGGEQLIACKTQDVSMGGAFLLTEELGFPKHRLLEISFPALQRLQLKQPVIIARAIRKEGKGLAVRFSKADRETIRAMHKMLQWRSYYPIETKQRRYLSPATPKKTN
ncbi:MAG: PilZ domain-containing protein [Sulfuriflexus sp.]|nr:PilZ domain-containing protein [Sulfuriflexus sp.]